MGGICGILDMYAIGSNRPPWAAGELLYSAPISMKSWVGYLRLNSFYMPICTAQISTLLSKGDCTVWKKTCYFLYIPEFVKSPKKYWNCACRLDVHVFSLIFITQDLQSLPV